MEHQPLTRILLVDDEATVREALKMRLRLEVDMQVVGEATNGLAAIRSVGETGPDIVIMDVRMPVMDGLESAAQIKTRYPDVAVLILTMHDSQRTREVAVRAGADAVLGKDMVDEALLPAIRALVAGKYEL